MAHLLLIDDDPAVIPRQVRHAFPAPSHQVEVARTGADGLDRMRAELPDVILLDLRLPDQSGMNVYKAIREIDARIPVIFVTVAKSADAAIEAMQQGAFDYLFKPIDLGQLQTVVAAALELARRMHEPAVVAENLPDADVEGAIIGICPAMREVYKAIGRVAGQNVPVLITGESGTGKELVALAIYQHGLRAREPFLTLNCAAIPETLLESELFGHEKGAFTSADRRRIGKFEQCSGGTLFLDEIGNLSLHMQAKLLGALETMLISRLGSDRPIRIDARVICATNLRAEELRDPTRFRQDLLYRINTIEIRVPPLRERIEDVPLLVAHYGALYARRYGKPEPRFDAEALERLQRYHWPGNVRELRHAIERVVIMSDQGLPQLDGILPPLPAMDAVTLNLEQLEKQAIQKAIVRHQGNLSRAAQSLGLGRTTLYRKMARYGLE
jgi:two-component system nitrogen regulation response regulator GlnG